MATDIMAKGIDEHIDIVITGFPICRESITIEQASIDFKSRALRAGRTRQGLCIVLYEPGKDDWIASTLLGLIVRCSLYLYKSFRTRKRH